MVKAITDRSAKQTEYRVGSELPESEETDIESGVSELKHEPRHCRALEPGARLRHKLTAKVETIIVVIAQAGKSPTDWQVARRETHRNPHTSRLTRRANGSIAASMAASSSGESIPRRVASQLVRRARRVVRIS